MALQFAGCVSTPQISDEVTQALKNTSNSDISKLGIVSLITAKRGKEGGGHCSGIAIAQTVILTAGHCCAADKISVIPWTTLSKDSVDSIQTARGCATVIPLDRKEEKMPERGMDLGIVALNKPLPKEITPVRLMPSKVLINAPHVKISGKSSLLPSGLKASEVSAILAQILPPERASFKPLKTNLHLVSVATDEGIVILSESPEGLIDDGTSGAGVFLPSAGGPQLLGLIVGSWKTKGGGRIPFAIDLRRHAEWIDKMTKVALQ